MSLVSGNAMLLMLNVRQAAIAAFAARTTSLFLMIRSSLSWCTCITVHVPFQKSIGLAKTAVSHRATFREVTMHRHKVEPNAPPGGRFAFFQGEAVAA